MKFSLIIPCYNEKANLPLVLARCKSLVSHPGCEVILVDNGSTDQSAQVLEELLPQYPGCRSIRVAQNQGYGFGVLSGLRASQASILGWTHADMQTDPVDTLNGLQLFEAHGDAVFVKGLRYGRPFFDTMFTAGMSCFESVLLGTFMRDINAQPTMFSQAFFETWRDAPHDFSLDLYAYYMAQKQRLQIHRFPVQFAKRAHGVSHWNINFASKRKFIQRTINYSLTLRHNLRTHE
jgi:glycosyltransferase involved in cell wall biosynthesis